MATETARRAFETARHDRWWLPPLASGLGLAAFGVYALVAAALGDDYATSRAARDYLSPFYSPDLEGWGLDVPFSSAFLVIWVPLGVPGHVLLLPEGVLPGVLPGSAGVRGDGRRAGGAIAARRRFPYVLMNAHRFFLTSRTIVLGFLWYDAVRAFFFRGSDGSLHLGVGRRDARAGRQRRPPRRCSRSAATRSATWSAAGWTASRAPPPRGRGTSSGAGVDLLEYPAHGVGVDQPRLGRARRPLHPARGGWASSTTRGSSEWRSSARLRRGRDRRRRRRAARGDRGRGAGARTALVCKSLLGKAHTVMAEGGVAASLGNVAARRQLAACTSRTRCSAAST